jgi:N utilization substance protein A
MSEEQLSSLDGMTKENYDLLMSLMKNSLEIVDEEPEPVAPTATENESGETEEAEEYECPECGAPITIDMTTCPNCGIGLSFEFEDEE